MNPFNQKNLTESSFSPNKLLDSSPFIKKHDSEADSPEESSKNNFPDIADENPTHTPLINNLKANMKSHISGISGGSLANPFGKIGEQIVQSANSGKNVVTFGNEAVLTGKNETNPLMGEVTQNNEENQDDFNEENQEDFIDNNDENQSEGNEGSQEGDGEDEEAIYDANEINDVSDDSEDIGNQEANKVIHAAVIGVTQWGRGSKYLKEETIKKEDQGLAQLSLANTPLGKTEEIPLLRLTTSANQSPVKKKETNPTLKKGKNVNFNKQRLLKLAEQENALMKQKVKEGRQNIKKAINKRKFVRYASLFLYLIIIGVTMGVGFSFLIQEGKFTSSPGANLAFKIDQCHLHILDHNSDVQSPIYIDYHIPKELKIEQATIVDIAKDSDPQTLTVINTLDPRYCLIKLFVKENTPLGSLNIECGRCNITQDTSFQLEVTNALTMTGDRIHANFRNAKVGSLNYQSNTGYIQLSNIESASSSNIVNMNFEGDIIIQSTADMIIDATTETQAFCFYAPFVQKQNNFNCAVLSSSGNEGTDKTRTDCQVVYNVCGASGCSPTARYNIISKTGNIYANIIPAVGSPVTGSAYAKGQLYDDGIGFSSQVENVVSNFSTLVDDETKGNPFSVLNIGDLGSKSARYNKWVVSSAPSYAMMKPWWIGTMSLTILNGYSEETHGFLLPGFCPYIPQYTMENLLEIQTLITNKINLENILVTFVSDEAMPLPPTSAQENTGVFQFVQSRNPFDRWYSLVRLSNGLIALENNDYSKKGVILAAVIVSLVIAAYVSYLVMKLTIVGINLMYIKLVEFANHLDSYARLEQSQLEKSLEENKTSHKKKKVINLAKYTLGNILRNSPSPSAFVDYLTLILYGQFSNSCVQFYNLLFKEVDPDAIQDQELDPVRDMIKGTEAKVLYEKFCFMNHLNEEKLTDKNNVKLLKKYGFEIVTREDLLSEVFSRMNVKNYDNFLVPSIIEDENLDSLDIYMRENVEITEFQEDQVEVETFIRIYNSFCDFNRLPRVLISPSLMKQKFEINVNVVPQQLIMRKEQVDDFNPNYNLTWGQKLTNWYIKKTAKITKTYEIDKSKLENNFNLVMNKITELSPKDLESATIDLILYPRWWLWDAFTVLFHMLIGGILTIPLLLLVILNESQYTPWSLKEPWNLITFQDIARDPIMLLGNIYTCFTWNIVIMIIVSVLWIMTFLDLIMYYGVMEFPQDKSFKRSEDEGESFLQKLSRQIEWLLVLLALAFYFGYIGLVLTWLLVGAFINPNSFLPFASAAVTFVAFVGAKYRTFKSLSEKGSKAVMDHLKKLFGGFINNLLDKVTLGLERVTNLAMDKGKSVLETGTFKAVTGKLAETGIVDAATIAEFTHKVQSLDGKTVMTGAMEVANDPTIIIKEMEKLTNELKEQTIAKVKEECVKRGIPPSFVDLVIAIALKENQKTKEALMQCIIECNNNSALYLSQGSIEVIMELLFPQGVNKEEMITFITTKIIKLIFEIVGLNGLENITPEDFIKLFLNFKNIQELKLEPFVKGLRELLTNIKNAKNLQELDVLLPILDIVGVLGKDKPEYWKLKDPALALISASGNVLADEDKNKVVQNFVQFLSLLSSGYEVTYDFETKESLDNTETLEIVKNFCNSIGLNKDLCARLNIHENFIPNFLYLAISYTRQESHEIPIEVIRDFESMFGLKSLGKNEFISFVFNLANCAFNTPKRFYRRINQCLSSFNVKPDLQDFIKAINCYALEDYENQYPINIEENTYFQEISKSLKTNPKELLGLIDIIYNKINNKYRDEFLCSILKRMSLKDNKLTILQPLIAVFLSEDEPEVLQAVRALNLKYGRFLLMGKGILNPRFILDQEYNEIGITNPDLIKEKNMIYNSSDDNFEYWKGELRKHITETLAEKRRKLIQTMSQPGSLNKEEQEDLDNLEREYNQSEAQANLIKFYLSNWSSHSFSRNNITTFIEILNNPTNNLKKQATLPEKGSSYTLIDFLTLILSIKELELVKGNRHERFDKEKENSIQQLSEYLSVSPEGLRNFVQIFIMKDKKDVLNAFYYFFPKLKEDQEIFEKVFAYSFKQVDIIKIQIEFITRKLPYSIELFNDKTLNLPTGLFRKFLFNKSDFSIGDLLDLSYLAIRKLAPKDQHDTLLKSCYTVGLFAKGLLSEQDLVTLFKVHDERFLRLFNVLTQPEHHVRLSAATELFKEKYHPIKLALAFYGLFTDQKFNIRHIGGIVQGASIPEEPIKAYLAGFLKVYPEVFDLFEIIFERNISKFIQKSLPLIRRINKSSLVDTNLIESLFSLSLGERFNSTNLANRLDILPEIIDFFMTLTRLASKNTRKKELNDLPQLISAQKVFTRLKIATPELIALTRLIFNLFDNDTSTEKAIEQLGFLKGNTKNKNNNQVAVETDLFNGFSILNKATDAKLDIFKNRVHLNSLKAKVSNFFSSLGLSTNSDTAFLISRITAGNFLAIKEYSNLLEWVFPVDDPEKSTAMMSLTMALCGLVNPNVEVTDTLHKEVKAFVAQYYPKKNKKFEFAEVQYKVDDKVLPNNTLAYAIYLSYHSMDIYPIWTQAFMFDKKAISSIQSVLPNIGEEFILSVVLYFTHLSEVMKDLLALNEWDLYCRNYYLKAQKLNEEDIGASAFVQNDIDKFFADKMAFDYEKVVELANASGILHDSNWSNLFINSEVYNHNINTSLFHLLISSKDTLESQDLFSNLTPHLKKPPSQFLVQFIKLTQNLDTVNDSRVQVGKMIKEAIIQCYKVVGNKMYSRDQRIQGYELTNFCILGAIATLRKSIQLKIPFERALYLINQIVANFERKVFLDDYFYRISKFKLIKLIGISLGYSINNAIEWSLIKSYFTNEYSQALKDAASDAERKMIRAQRIKEFVLDYKNETNYVGDLGRGGGIFDDFVYYFNEITTLEDWNTVNLFFGIADEYFGETYSENKEYMVDKAKVNKMVDKCKIREDLYLNRELVRLIYKDLDKYHNPENEENKSAVGDDKSAFGDERSVYDGIKTPQTYTDHNANYPHNLGNPEFSKNNSYWGAQTGNFGFNLGNAAGQMTSAINQGTVVASDLAQTLENQAQGIYEQGKQGTTAVMTTAMRRNKKVKETDEAAELKEKVIDPKTGLVYKTIAKKVEEFEEALCNPNTILIQRIIKGDPSALMKGDHIIIKNDPQKKKARVYMALIGLQSFRKKHKDDRKLFREYLNIIAPNIESDITRLDELLTFFITGVPILNEIVNTLEIHEHVLDLLLMSIKAKTTNNAEEEEDELNAFILEAVEKVLDIPSEDLEAFNIMRNIYQFNREKGWVELIDKLRKDVVISEGNNDAEEHVLVKLIRKLNFGKLRKEAGSVIDRNILQFITIPQNSKDHPMKLIFKEVISEVSTLLNDKFDKEFLAESYEAFQDMVNLDIQKLFKRLILAESDTLEAYAKEESTQKKESFIEKLFTLIGVDPKAEMIQKGIKLIKIFLVFNSRDLSSFKNDERFGTVLDNIINDITESELLSFLSNNKELQKNLSQLLVGVLAWDFGTIIKAFVMPKTLEEAYLFYHIYGCLNIKKIFNNETDNWQARSLVKKHLQVVLSVVYKQITQKSTSFLFDGIGDFDYLFKNDMYPYGSSEKYAVESLERMIDSQLKLIHTDNPKQSKTLFQHIMQSFNPDFEGFESYKTLDVNGEYETFSEFIQSICNGSFLKLALNTFVKDPKLKNLLEKLAHLIFRFVEKFSRSGKKIGYEGILEALESSTKAIIDVTNNQIMTPIFTITPDVLKIYFGLQSDRNMDLAEVKAISVAVIKKLILQTIKQNQNLSFNLMSVILGVNMKSFNENEPGNKLKSDMAPSERIELFFSAVLPDVFPGINDYIYPEEFMMIYHLIMKLKTDFAQNFKDPYKLRGIVKDILEIISGFGGLNTELTDSIINLLDGDLLGANKLVAFLVPGANQESIKKMLMYAEETRGVLNFDFINKFALPSSDKSLSRKEKITSEDWAAMLKKIKDGTASSKELFQAIDEAGDKSGTISEMEFQLLVNRLGMKLSDHRIKEIFAKVKRNKTKGISDQDLNEKEFEQALDYLQEKNIMQALQQLGITPEILTAIFIRLVILLILIFIFIFLGIKAFAIGGTFGAIINSLFPAIGGLSLGKEKEGDKEKLNERNVEKASETAFEITTSEQL